jgi:hypothetical protein
MVGIGESVEFGGHKTIRINARSGDNWKYKCQGCGTVGESNLFTTGTRGCAGEADSLNYISVCPGGEKCQGHPDTDSREWAEWKASDSLPVSHYPKITCPAWDKGVRALSLFREFARKVGMAPENWQEVKDKEFPPDADTMRLAEFDLKGKHFALWVGKNGKITVTRWNGTWESK